MEKLHSDLQFIHIAYASLNINIFEVVPMLTAVTQALINSMLKFALT